MSRGGTFVQTDLFTVDWRDKINSARELLQDKLLSVRGIQSDIETVVR